MSGIMNDNININNVDLTHAKTLKCEKCECLGFKQTLMLKNYPHLFHQMVKNL